MKKILLTLMTTSILTTPVIMLLSCNEAKTDIDNNKNKENISNKVFKFDKTKLPKIKDNNLILPLEVDESALSKCNLKDVAKALDLARSQIFDYFIEELTMRESDEIENSVSFSVPQTIDFDITKNKATISNKPNITIISNIFGLDKGYTLKDMLTLITNKKIKEDKTLMNDLSDSIITTLKTKNTTQQLGFDKDEPVIIGQKIIFDFIIDDVFLALENKSIDVSEVVDMVASELTDYILYSDEIKGLGLKTTSLQTLKIIKFDKENNQAKVFDKVNEIYFSDIFHPRESEPIITLSVLRQAVSNKKYENMLIMEIKKMLI